MDLSTISAVAAAALSVVAYLLKQKDEKQAKEIDALRAHSDSQHALLWQKHDQDARALAELRLHIASQHYVKTELDARFDRMEASFNHGFHDLSGKLDKLIDALKGSGK
jgi:hypothetical protein